MDDVLLNDRQEADNDSRLQVTSSNNMVKTNPAQSNEDNELVAESGLTKSNSIIITNNQKSNDES